jgi:hypothetical protein
MIRIISSKTDEQMTRDQLISAHTFEVRRRRARITNFETASEKMAIESETTKGWLWTKLDEDGKATHAWSKTVDGKEDV